MTDFVRRAFATAPAARVTLRTIRAIYERGTPLAMVTAYDYAGGRHVDESGADMALVGDSLGMVVLGHSNTQQVTLEQMIHHAKAVRKGVERALVVVDLPFGAYEASEELAACSAIRIIKETGADAVKIEGRRPRHASAIVQGGVPVMGHLGLSPQAVGVMGGFRPVGKCPEEAMAMLEGAREMAQAGCFGMVLECVPERVARAVTQAVDVPTIGIGAGVGCDGQVLVYHDALGIGDYSPKFAKRYREVGKEIVQGLKEFGSEVRERRFPTESSYRIDEELEWREFWKAAEQARAQRGNRVHADVGDQNFKLY